MRTRWWLVLLLFTAFFSSCGTCLLIGYARLPAAVGGHDNHVEEAEQRRVAIHESGHAIVAALLHGPDEVTGITVFAELDDGLYGVCHTKDENRLQTAEDVMKEAAVFMGGRAGDKIINGAPTNGATSDLANVTDMIWKMHLKSGLGDSLLVQDKSDAPASVRTAVERDIKRANACAEAIVTSNRPAVAALADAIMAKPVVKGERTLTKEEFEAFLDSRKIALPAAENGRDGPCDFSAD